MADKGKGLGIMIGIGKPSGGPPPPPKGAKGMPPMPGAKSAAADPMDPDADADDDGDKVSPDKAMVSHAEENCGACSNFSGGSCSKVSGQFDPTDRCYVFFSPMGGDDSDTPGDMSMGGADSSYGDSGGM